MSLLALPVVRVCACLTSLVSLPTSIYWPLQPLLHSIPMTDLSAEVPHDSQSSHQGTTAYTTSLTSSHHGLSHTA